MGSGGERAKPFGRRTWCTLGLLWGAYPLPARLVALAGVVIAADDVVEHAFGVWTPLDAFWRHVLFPVVSSL
ncbi:hypothetical protein [Halobacterium noricense]|uniref:hypothetical protein n=1 Tax=Halobacterium noricense TaxID=223182 RepID=UPI001E3DC49D|nr:hypothetical protein [Halobacterium noricense]UHH24888.1 hypothetical protein LT974_12985 [Halobacterium noricense]